MIDLENFETKIIIVDCRKFEEEHAFFLISDFFTSGNHRIFFAQQILTMTEKTISQAYHLIWLSCTTTVNGYEQY